MDPELSIEKRLGLIQMAIDRCEHFDELRQHCEALPTSSSDERMQSRLRLSVAENEFGWQRRNVKRLLEEKK